jgi:hypothetical protein
MKRCFINSDPNIKETENQRIQRIITFFTWIVVLFIPTYSKVSTFSRSGGKIEETTYFWPWMILFRLQPIADFQSDQYLVLSFPWSFLIFIPFLLILKYSLRLTKDSKYQLLTSVSILVLSVVQMIVIRLLFPPQNLDDVVRSDEITIYYIPQLIIISIFSIIIIFKLLQLKKVILTEMCSIVLFVHMSLNHAPYVVFSVALVE